MRVGLLHLAEESWGGLYQCSIGVIEGLMACASPHDFRILNFNDDRMAVEGQKLAEDTAAIDRGRAHFAARIYRSLNRAFPLLPILVPFSRTQLGQWVLAGGARSLDLVVSPVPALHLKRIGVPFVVVIPDFVHRFATNEFGWSERIYRDAMYRRNAKQSLLTVVYSERVRDDLNRFYGIDPRKVRVIPALPPSYVYKYDAMSHAETQNTLEKFALPEKFLFYPANFWPHKNHASLLRALSLLKQEKGECVPVVFVGQPKEAFTPVMRLVSDLDLQEQVKYLGFVSTKELAALYKRATAMVTPTLFEAGHLPILEALSLGTCCVASSSYGLCENRAADAALPIDPMNVHDIADKVWAVWSDEELRARMVRKGKLLIEERYSREAVMRQWLGIMSEAAALIRRGQQGTEAK